MREGPLGIDMLLYPDTEGFKWRPIIELNPRNTMGMLALALEPHVVRSGLLCFLSPQTYQDKKSAPAFRNDEQSGPLLDGLIALTSPSNATIACLAAGEAAEQLLGQS